MKLSTQTILVLGLVQCVILTLFLVLFFRYQKTLEANEHSPVAGTESSPGK